MGRPKGSKNKIKVTPMDKIRKGMSFEGRLEELSKIIIDPKTRNSDKINAIKLTTELLADKLKDPTKEAEINIVKFEDNIAPTIKEKENITNITNITNNNMNNTTSTTTTTTINNTQIVENKEVVEEKPLTMTIIEENNNIINIEDLLSDDDQVDPFNKK